MSTDPFDQGAAAPSPAPAQSTPPPAQRPNAEADARHRADESARLARREGERHRGDPREGENREAADPNKKHRIGNLELSETEARGLIERHALEVSKKATLPPTPADYKLDLPKDFKPPAGVEFTPDENDPRWPMLREYAHKSGWSQADVSKILELDAAGQVGTQEMIKNAKADELRKLGANATTRMSAINTFVAAIPGVAEADAKAFESFMLSAKQVEVMERIMAHVRNQGAGAPGSGHRDTPAENGKIPGYENMTFEQRRFAQDQMRNRGR